MKWDNLTMSQKQALMKIYVNNGITNLNEIVNHYNRFSEGGFTDDGYYDWIEKLAIKKSKDWEMSEDETLTMMLNDNTYNYREFYNRNREDALKMLTADPNAHFNDIGKTVYHPTFSKYSAYSGKVSDYNPRGTKGGNWRGNEYIPSKDQIKKGDFNYDRTNRYLEGTGEYINSKYNRFGEGGPIESVELPKTNDRSLIHGHTSYINSSSIPSERLNLRPTPGLLTDANVGAGVNLPFKELIDRFVLDKTNTPNIINTDSIIRPISYITRPRRINRFDDGGDKEVILPEIIITPEEWQKDFTENFGNKNIRNTLYKLFPRYVDSYNNRSNNFTENELENFQKTHDYEINYKKLYDIWNQTGRPKIKEKDVLTVSGLHNPHYIPILNTVVAKYPDSIIGELAHSALDKNESFDKIDYIKQWPAAVFDYVNNKKIARAFRKGKRDKAFKLAKNLNNVYESPKHYEYKTHSIVEPILKDYILGNLGNLDIKNISLEKK